MATKQDREAFGTLFARYKHLVFGVCLKYLEETERAKDAVQNIFLKIWNDSYKYQVNRFKPWLYKVAKNHCLGELRQKDPTAQLDTKSDIDDMEWVDYLHLKLKEEQLLTHLSHCMNNLKEEQYRCINSFYFEEKSYQQIAIDTGYTYKDIKSFIQNGRRNIKACMQTVITA